jgi:hypothetical protein
MPEYMLVTTGPDGHQDTSQLDFIDDSAAIEAAGRTVCAECPVISVARGAGADATLLGAWELDGGDAYWWSEF